MLTRIDGICFLELIIEPQYTLKQKKFFMGHTLCMYPDPIVYQSKFTNQGPVLRFLLIFNFFISSAPPPPINDHPYQDASIFC